MKAVRYLKDNGNKNAGEIAGCEDDEFERLVQLKIVEPLKPAAGAGEHRAILPPGAQRGRQVRLLAADEKTMDDADKAAAGEKAAADEKGK